MTKGPRTVVEQLERAAALPAGSNERFNGYGVMGLPFQSGHVLAMRRFPASSVGPAYTSVWHRNPAGEWVFYATVQPGQSCARYFGAIAADSVETPIEIEWTAPFRMRVTMPALAFDWDVEVAETAATRLMSAMGQLLPDAAWRSPAVLGIMGRLADPLLSAGRVALNGRVPNGQGFVANPRLVWAVARSSARLGKEDFGKPGPVRPQARLGDFWIPQRGLLAIGQAFFDPFDPAVHSQRSSGEKRPGEPETS